jgi:hypothetical protein
VAFHLIDAVERLQRAEQHAAPDAGNFAAHVEHEMIAVRKVDVSMSAPQKHRSIARGRTAKMMGGWVARRVRFGFNDAARHSAGREFANDDLADQEPG